MKIEYIEDSRMHIARFNKNEKGRDFVIGDIHGCFSRVTAELTKIGFDETQDRLFSVGDLVDRGPESDKVLEWLAKPWFHAVTGNHEQMLTLYKPGRMDIGMYQQNGCSWFMAKSDFERAEFVQIFKSLPLAIEVETPEGVVGIIHAECPNKDWGVFHEKVGRLSEYEIDYALWARGKIDSKNGDNIPGIHKIFVGHTPLSDPVQLGNVHYIDTVGWSEGRFTIVQL